MTQSLSPVDDFAKHRLRHQTRAERFRCRTDLWYLLKDVLGYTKLAQLHREIIAEEARTRDQTVWRVFLISRGHAKSTILNIGAHIQRILRTHGLNDDPDHLRRLRAEHNSLIGGWKEDIVAKYGVEIRQHLETNKRLRMLFPDILWENPQSQARSLKFEWSNTEMTVQRMGVHRIPTLTFFTMKSLPASFHADAITIDDGESDENTSSLAMRKKLKEAYDRLLPLRKGTKPQITVVGTIAHGDGAHTYLQALAKDAEKRERPPRYRIPVYIRRAIEDGKAIWPEEFPLDALEDMQYNQPDMFSRHYQMNPTLSSIEKIDPDDIQYYDAKSLPPRSHFRTVVITVDVARAVTDRSDYTAIVVVGYHSDGRKFLLDGIYDKTKPEDTVRALKALNAKWKPDETPGVEKNGLEEFLGAVCRLMGYEDYQAIKSRGNKEDRIRKTLPIVRSKNMWVPSDIPDRIGWDHKPYNLTECFVQELLGFPSAPHDDLLDTLQMADDLAGYEPAQLITHVPGKTISHIDEMRRERHAHFDEIQANLKQGNGDPYSIGGDYARNY